jgi:hypothetical protein
MKSDGALDGSRRLADVVCVTNEACSRLRGARKTSEPVNKRIELGRRCDKIGLDAIPLIGARSAGRDANSSDELSGES